MAVDQGDGVREQSSAAGMQQQQQDLPQRQQEQQQQSRQELPTRRELLRMEIDQMPPGTQRDKADQAFKQGDQDF